MVSYFQDTLVDVSPAINAAGFGNLTEVAVNNLFSTSNYTLIAVVTNFSSNIAFQLDGSIDNVSFVPLATGTATGNGPVVISVSGRPVKWVRPRFVSGAGTVVFQLAAN